MNVTYIVMVTYMPPTTGMGDTTCIVVKFQRPTSRRSTFLWRYLTSFKRILWRRVICRVAPMGNVR